MNEALNEYLKKFEMLTNDEMQIIKDCTTIKTFTKGTVILKEGQSAADGYLILQGCMREYFLKNGEEKTTGIYIEGDPVNHYNDSSISKHNIECVEDCTVSLSNQKLIETLVEKIPRIHDIIQQASKDTMRKMKEDMSTFMASSPEERYLNLIDTRPEIFNRVPQHQVASYLGIKPQSLSRLRKRLLTKKKSS